MRHEFNLTRLTSVIAPIFGLALLSAGCERKVETAPVVVTPAPAVTSAPATTAPATTTGTVNPTAPGATVKVADITGNSANYHGKTVTVVADVEEVKGPRAFVLDEDSALKGGIDNDLLVLSPKAGSLANIDDQWLKNKVRVTGVVHRFVTADVEREIGWDLDRQIEVEFEGKKPVLIATSIERVR